MIEEIPEKYENIEVISNSRKEFYIKCLKSRYEKSLYPAYKKALELQEEQKKN